MKKQASESAHRQRGAVTLVTLWVATVWDPSIRLLPSDFLSTFRQPPPRPPSLPSQVNQFSAASSDMKQTHQPLTRCHAAHEPLGDTTSGSTCRDKCVPITVVLAETHWVEPCGSEGSRRLPRVPAGSWMTFWAGSTFSDLRSPPAFSRIRSRCTKCIDGTGFLSVQQ